MFGILGRVENLQLTPVTEEQKRLPPVSAGKQEEQQSAEPEQHEEPVPPVGGPEEFPADWTNPVPYLLGIATRGLTDSIERTDHDTWTSHLSLRLAAHAEECVQSNNAETADLWSKVVTGKADASIAEAKKIEYTAWADAVTIRFEVKMTQNEDLKDWVEVLNRRDEQTNQLAMLDIAAGIRVALWVIAIVLILTLPADIHAVEQVLEP